MSDKPPVSVIVTTFNRQALLGETIRSILDQQYRDLELIVVDNCSNYDISAFTASFNDPRITAVRNNNDGIIAVNRNLGIKTARGNYIAFCDDDDIWKIDKLEKQMKVFEKHNGLFAVCSNGYTFPNGLSNFAHVHHSQFLTFRKMLGRNYVITSSIVVKKSVIDSIGSFDENRGLMTLEDYDLWLRICNYRDKSIFFLNKKLVGVRNHRSNTSMNVADYSARYSAETLSLLVDKFKSKEALAIDKSKRQIGKRIKLHPIKAAFYGDRMSTRALLSNKELSMKVKIELIIKKAINRLFYKKT